MEYIIKSQKENKYLKETTFDGFSLVNSKQEVLDRVYGKLDITSALERARKQFKYSNMKIVKELV